MNAKYDEMMPDRRKKVKEKVRNTLNTESSEFMKMKFQIHFYF